MSLFPVNLDEHGTRWHYNAGCRCFACTLANARYKMLRAEANARGDWNGWVSPEQAKARLELLAEKGIGHRQAAKLAGISVTTVQRIRSGESQNIRAKVEQAILSITPTLAHGAIVNGYHERRRLKDLKSEGFTLQELAERLRLPRRWVEQDHHPMRVRNVLKVRRLWDVLMAEGPEATA